MSDKVDVRALAKLARLEVTEAELEKLQQEIPSILAFVETIQSVEGARRPSTSFGSHNVMRDDTNPHESGMYTEKLLAQAPAKKGDRFVVKQVISRKK